MELGAWVEFEQIVTKQPTSAGSQPTTQRLGRTRRGMVVGMRHVYDVTTANPPVLANPREVLLVAVSLHRSYRVYPGDARPTTPPKPRRRRQTSSAPVAALALTSQPPVVGATLTLTPGSTGRSTLLQADLEVLVANEINRHVTSGTVFTAYDITLALRSTYPAYNIPHDTVRSVVHSQMNAIVASGLYTKEVATFLNGSSANRYVPF
jgi:hypothetical protein